jgi:hypothetical protein
MEIKQITRVLYVSALSVMSSRTDVMVYILQCCQEVTVAFLAVFKKTKQRQLMAVAMI